ncbi:hypothetical protein, partial [Paracoccus litorisediminis]|uniref:hypothetical protein n=1 Tax=Paracoccus litorisediminis TaxID=2006130 RepID=UPI001B8AD12C
CLSDGFGESRGAASLVLQRPQWAGSYGRHFLSHSMLGGSSSPPFRAGTTTLGCSQVQHRA